MPAHRVATLLGEVDEYRLELRMDRALAAIHHDGDVEQFVELDEKYVVVIVEGIAADRIRPEIALRVMPTKARAADGDRRAAVSGSVVGVGCAAQGHHMTMHA